MRRKSHVPQKHIPRRQDHSNTHCFDFNKDCPLSCYRAALTVDLQMRYGVSELDVSWASFKDTEECQRRDK